MAGRRRFSRRLFGSARPLAPCPIPIAADVLNSSPRPSKSIRAVDSPIELICALDVPRSRSPSDPTKNAEKLEKLPPTAVKRNR
jgi:hypothetical protein